MFSYNFLIFKKGFEYLLGLIVSIIFILNIVLIDQWSYYISKNQKINIWLKLS